MSKATDRMKVAIDEARKKAGDMPVRPKCCRGAIPGIHTRYCSKNKGKK